MFFSHHFIHKIPYLEKTSHNFETNFKNGGKALIEVKNITKKYGDNLAVNDVSFTIKNGSICGFLGPNGAGKSTTMNIITGCLSADSGSVSINGFDILDDPIEAKRLIGYLPENPPLYNEMTVYEYLAFVAEAKNVNYSKMNHQIREVMDLTGILSVKDRLIKNLSKGYRQRVGIAQTMLGSPEIIILDEPTVGLDPKQIVEIRDLIRHLGKSKTVIISSHILAEINEVCDHVVIISRGEVVADEDMVDLEAKAVPMGTLRLSIKGDIEGIREVLSSFDQIKKITELPTKKDGVCELSLKVSNETDVRDDIFFAMAERRYAVITMEKEASDLENIFLSLTKETGGVKSKKAKKAKKEAK